VALLSKRDDINYIFFKTPWVGDSKKSPESPIANISTGFRDEELPFC